MTIQYPVRVSLTDETLIVDQDNASIATTFFGKEDYDAKYERRALDAAVIVECLNKRKALNELEEAGIVAGEAYQVIGDLALAVNLYDHPEVQRALDWFSGFEPGVTYKDDASILPWPREEFKPDDYSVLTTRISALELALRPFAAVAEHDIGGDEADEDVFKPIHFNNAPKLLAGDLRRARSALAKKEG